MVGSSSHACFQKTPNPRNLHLRRVIFILRTLNFEMSKNYFYFLLLSLIQCKNPTPKCGIFACIFFVNATWWRLLDSNCRAYLSSIHTYSQKPLFATVSGASFWHLFTTEAIKNTSLKGKTRENKTAPQVYLIKFSP